MNAPSTAARLLLFHFLVCLLQTGLPAFAANTNAPLGSGRNVEAPQFDILTLQRPGVVFMADSGDLDGDGATDLLLFHKSSKETYEKSCSIYFQRKGSFPATQPLEIQLGETISAIDIGDVDSDGKDEICAFDADGMVVFELNDEASFESDRPLECRTLLPSAARRIAAVNWLGDIDSDGKMDVVLPAADGMHLFLQKGGNSFAEAQTFELPIRASVSGDGGQNYIRYRLPTVEFSDFDGDGRIDFGAFDLEQMNFFLTDGSGAPSRHVTSPLIRKFTRDFIGATSFPDLSGDGVPDAVLVLMSQKKNLQSEVRIYFGKKDLSYGDEPSNIYSGETNLILPMFLDATGDGKIEMLLQNVDVGFSFFFNYFIRNRIRVDAELRRLGADGKFDEKPAIRRAIYVRASETGVEPARCIGDFNGDGLDDLVVGTSENRLSFYLSNKKVFLPRRPTFGLKVPAYGAMKTLNMNNDGRADLIILYPQEDKLDTATLLLSR